MQLTQFHQRQKLIHWAERIKAVAEKRKDLVAAGAIQREIEELNSGKFMLAVLGKVKRGKSTFCNAFLGRQNDLVAPVDKLPASSVISKIIWGAEEQVRVIFRNGNTELTSYQRIVDFVTEERNPENKKEVACVEVSGPFPGLEKDLVLVDTPGAGSMHKHHDELLHNFLPEADAVIFLVTARMPVAEDELELLRALKKHEIKKVFFAINQTDLLEDGRMTEKELQDGIEHNLRMLGNAGISVEKLYPISARRAMLGDVGKSGIPELLADISEFLAKNKLHILHSNFEAKVLQAAEALARNIAIEIDSGNKTGVELAADLARLKDARQKMDGERKVIEKRFQLDWSNAVADYENGLQTAEDSAKMQIQKAIQQDFPTFGANKFVKSLPTLLTRGVEEVLSPVANAFETAAREAVERLQLAYPNISVGSTGAVTVKIGGESSTLIKGATGAAVTAVAGFGLISAAAAAVTTATIAVPTALSGLATLLPASIAGIWTSLTMGSTVISTAPAWAAAAGPIGWTLIGIGALVVPFAYRAANLKLKNKVEEAADEQIKKMFTTFRTVRLSQLRKTGERILDEYRLKLDNDLAQIELVLNRGLERKANFKGTEDLERLGGELKLALEQPRA